MNIIEQADILISENSKEWFCEKLGISRPTLNTRLKHDNWKKSEIQMILLLKKKR